MMPEIPVNIRSCLGKSDGCDENILYVQFNYPDKTHYLIGWECFPTLGWGGMNPTQSLVDAFEDKDGAPISKSTIYNEKDPFKNRDPRLEVNVLHDGEEMYGVTIKVKPLKSSGKPVLNSTVMLQQPDIISKNG